MTGRQAGVDITSVKDVPQTSHAETPGGGDDN